MTTNDEAREQRLVASTLYDGMVAMSANVEKRAQILVVAYEN
jgi:hypothetical protein